MILKSIIHCDRDEHHVWGAFEIDTAWDWNDLKTLNNLSLTGKFTQKVPLIISSLRVFPCCMVQRRTARR
jgi:hypothetical protein